MMILSLLVVSDTHDGALRAQMPTPAGSFAQLANSIITSLFRFVIETDSRPSRILPGVSGSWNSTRHGLLSQRLPLIYGKTEEAVQSLVEKLTARPGAGRDAVRKNRPDILAGRRRSVARRRCVRERDAFLPSHESARAIAAAPQRGQRAGAVESAGAE